MNFGAEIPFSNKLAVKAGSNSRNPAGDFGEKLWFEILSISSRVTLRFFKEDSNSCMISSTFIPESFISNMVSPDFL